MSDESPRIRHVIGCMTGTSLDGLDVALVRISGTGLDMTTEFIGMVSAPLPDALRTTLLSMAHGEAHPPIEFMRAARYLGVVHAEACAELISKHAGPGSAVADAGGVDFIVAHGQTIWHAPADRLSWQLFDPWPMVRTLNLPVCYDLRQADLVAGGEGAPITPIADWVMYRERADAVINLGGIANVTWLKSDVSGVTGRDIGPCNILLDGLCQLLFEAPFDRDGAFADRGAKKPDVWRLIDQAVSSVTNAGSQGRELYGGDWLMSLATHCQSLEKPVDILATAVCWVAEQIKRSVEQQDAKRWVLAGGGVKNIVLTEWLRVFARPTLRLSDDLGIPAEAREAMGFGVLGALSADGVPITLPGVTGSETPGVAGVWAYPEGPAGTSFSG